MPSSTEIDRLAAMANALRPDWPVSSLRTYLTARHSHRCYADLAVALATIATDATTRTPKRLDESGPWWQAAQAASGERIRTPAPPRFVREPFTGISPVGRAALAEVRRVLADRKAATPPTREATKK